MKNSEFFYSISEVEVQIYDLHYKFELINGPPEFPGFIAASV